MPLHDHFRTPIKNRLPWASLHNGWMGNIAQRLNKILPSEFVAFDRMYINGGLEVDIGTVEEEELDSGTGSNGHGGTTVATAKSVYVPPPATGTAPFDLADVSEIRVFTNRGEGRLVAAIELVSPGNKDGKIKREAFVAKCVDYLASGASLLVVDLVTDHRTNLHNEIIGKFDAPIAFELPEDSYLYAVAYRPVVRDQKTEIEMWIEPLAVGDRLPTMPLRLVGDTFVPVELELTYTETCVGRRLI